jgi:hypothetical protein
LKDVRYLILLKPWGMKKSGNYITTVNKESGILRPGRFRPGPPRNT